MSSQATFTATLDVRHAQESSPAAAVRIHRVRAEHCVRSRSTVAFTSSIDQSAVPMDSDLSACLAAASHSRHRRRTASMTSGAGHDAMVVARRIPAAMLFLRIPGGLSHHPDESVLATMSKRIRHRSGVPAELRDDRAMRERMAARHVTTKAGEDSMHSLGHTRSANRTTICCSHQTASSARPYQDMSVAWPSSMPRLPTAQASPSIPWS